MGFSSFQMFGTANPEYIIALVTFADKTLIGKK